MHSLSNDSTDYLPTKKEVFFSWAFWVSIVTCASLALVSPVGSTLRNSCIIVGTLFLALNFKVFLNAFRAESQTVKEFARTTTAFHFIYCFVFFTSVALIDHEISGNFPPFVYAMLIAIVNYLLVSVIWRFGVNR